MIIPVHAHACHRLLVLTLVIDASAQPVGPPLPRVEYNTSDTESTSKTHTCTLSHSHAQP
jgi:hypothetical protein